MEDPYLVILTDWLEINSYQSLAITTHHFTTLPIIWEQRIMDILKKRKKKKQWTEKNRK